MGVCFKQGDEIGRGNLDIFLTSADTGNPSNAYSIHYALYCVDPKTGQEVLIGPPKRTPVNPQVGEYYAALQIPPNASIGNYRIRWVFQKSAGSPEEGAVMEFCVVGESVTTKGPTVSACESELIRRLRFQLRDTNPDRNYRFRPPEGEGKVGCYNQVFGFIWEDEELLEFLRIALDKWNMHPPATEEYSSLEILCREKPSWKAAMLWGALVSAAQAMAYNWIVDEFSVAGDTLVRVILPDGREVDLPIADLHAICHGGDHGPV